jgi:hypothetical protein
MDTKWLYRSRFRTCFDRMNHYSGDNFWINGVRTRMALPTQDGTYESTQTDCEERCGSGANHFRALKLASVVGYREQMCGVCLKSDCYVEEQITGRQLYIFRAFWTCECLFGTNCRPAHLVEPFLPCQIIQLLGVAQPPTELRKHHQFTETVAH